MGNQVDDRSYRYRFTGHERVLHNVCAEHALPDVLGLFGYQRAFVVCSRTLNRKSDAVRNIASALKGRMVGLTDEVGEHSPLSNVIKAAKQARF